MRRDLSSVASRADADRPPPRNARRTIDVLGELNTAPSGPKAKGKSKTPSPAPAPQAAELTNDALEKRRNKLARQASETQKRSFTEALDKGLAPMRGAREEPAGRQTGALS